MAGRAASYDGSPEEIAQVIKEFAIKRDWLKYPKRGTDIRLNVSHKLVLQSLANLSSNLSFQQFKMQRATKIVFDDCKSGWPIALHPDHEKLWLEVNAERVRSMCGSCMKARRNGGKWALELWDEAVTEGDKLQTEEEGQERTGHTEEGEEEEEVLQAWADAGGDPWEEADEEKAGGAASPTPPATIPHGPVEDTWMHGYCPVKRMAWRCPSKKPTKKEYIKPFVMAGTTDDDPVYATWDSQDSQYEKPVYDLTVKEFRETELVVHETASSGVLFSTAGADGKDYKIMRTRRKEEGDVLLAFRTTEKTKGGKEQLFQIIASLFGDKGSIEAFDKAFSLSKAVLEEIAQGKVEDTRDARKACIKSKMKKEDEKQPDEAGTTAEHTKDKKCKPTDKKDKHTDKKCKQTDEKAKKTDNTCNHPDETTNQTDEKHKTAVEKKEANKKGKKVKKGKDEKKETKEKKVKKEKKEKTEKIEKDNTPKNAVWKAILSPLPRCRTRTRLPRWRQAATTSQHAWHICPRTLSPRLLGGNNS